VGRDGTLRDVATLRVVSTAEGTPGDVAFTLSGDEISLGRDLDNSIVLADQAVSRHHGKLLRTTRGWLLVDARSGNGIWMNGQRVTNHFLADGDLFRMGRTLLRFEDGAVGAPGRPAAPSRTSRAAGLFVLLGVLALLFALALSLAVLVISRSRPGVEDAPAGPTPPAKTATPAP
jgi:hypothetical protein